MNTPRSIGVYKYKTYEQTRPPMHVHDLQKKLMRWTLAREDKGLDAEPLRIAIGFLNEYKQILGQQVQLERYVDDEVILQPELPSVKGFVEHYR